MLPLGVSAVTLGFGFLVTLDRPPLDLRSSALLVPIAQAHGGAAARRTHAGAGAALGRPPAAAGRGLAGRVARCGCCSPSTCRSLWRPLLAATGFAFAVSLGEFGATSFLARPDRPTLPVVIYQLCRYTCN